ncbi:hypothetical protein QJS10_CPA02g00319 [Acorus calamus]|uniref:Uncharacterized protein n=1 Tax=Acorus calamus TaxID=4465 RepID=A0AAV9FCS5_ACOCL|nr:hypothetical protein QJS10_CPA02g00319 [Acorus calamus]
MDSEAAKGFTWGRGYSDDAVVRYSDASMTSSAENSDFLPKMPSTPTPTSSGLRLSMTGSRSSKRSRIRFIIGCFMSRYSHDEEADDDQEETGWKYIHGDVF